MKAVSGNKRFIHTMERCAGVILIWLLQCSLGVNCEGCDSPQYLEYKKIGVINCSFHGNFTAVFWYDSTNIDNDEPIVALINSVKDGNGYESGEFDIFSNGSLLITEVSAGHGKNFTVAKLTSLDEKPTIFVVLVVVTGVLSDGCDSPQYLEYGRRGIIHCHFQTFDNVLWYNSTDTVVDVPILAYDSRGNTSGEFDVFSNGSLVIHEVGMVHDHQYTVVKFTSMNEAATYFVVLVIVTVKSLLGGPIIDKCASVNTTCYVELDRFSAVDCTVRRVRPAVSLKWLIRTGYGDRNMSFNVNSISDDVTFTSSAVTSDVFAYSPVLSLLVCKADFVPGVLQRDESLVLVQNSERNLSSVPYVIKYAPRNSTVELECTSNEISFFVWKRSFPFDNDYQNLIFAISIENYVVTEYQDHFNVGKNGSLVLRNIDLQHEGFYICIYGDGITDAITKYKVVTYVKPVPPYPVVDGCNYQQNCVLEVHRKGKLKCSMTGVRPEVNLEWKLSDKTSSGTISFFDHTSTVTKSGETFNITLTSSYSVQSMTRVAVVCGVSGTSSDIFPEIAVVDLLFVPVNQTDDSSVPVIVYVVVFALLFVGLLSGIRFQKVCCYKKKSKTGSTMHSDIENIPMLSSNDMLHGDIKAKLFAKFKGVVAEKFKRDDAVKIAVCLNLTPAKKSEIQSARKPGLALLNYLQNDDIINEDNIEGLCDALVHCHLKRTAQIAKEEFEKYKSKKEREGDREPPCTEGTGVGSNSYDPGTLRGILQDDLTQDDCFELAIYFSLPDQVVNTIQESNIYANELLDTLQNRTIISKGNISALLIALKDRGLQRVVNKINAAYEQQHIVTSKDDGPATHEEGSAHCNKKKSRRGSTIQSDTEGIPMVPSNDILHDDIKEKEFELPSEPEYSSDEDENDSTNTFENLLEKVGLKDKYPAKLKLKTLLKLGNNEQNNYVHIFWQKLISFNYHAGILQELVSEHYSMRDFIFCVLHCADEFLRQDILEKMSACQLAVPVVLQGVANSKPVFLLWALRRVVKKWKGESDSFAIEQPIVSYPVLNISVLRIGDVQISKSQLLNTMLSYSQGYSSHTFFLNREKDFVVPRYSSGSVECAWFLPMWDSENQIFKEVIAFFNLRGDCTKYPHQTSFVCKAAHLTIALIATSKHKYYNECISLIRKNSKSTLFISVSDGVSQKVHRPKYKDGCFFVNVVQMDILSETISKEIVKTCKLPSTGKICLDSLADICGEQIQIDEQEEYCKNAQNAVCKIFGNAKCVNYVDVLEFKKSSFPLQSLWKDWVEIDKSSLHTETEVHESFEHQMERKKFRKREKRKSQLQKNLSQTMENYLRVVKSAKSNSAMLQYIFGFMQENIYHMVNEDTKNDMNDIADLEREIRQIKNTKMTGLYGNDDDGSESEKQRESEARNASTYNLKVKECSNLYRKCGAKNLGCEHFLRELGQLYEAYMDLLEEDAPQIEGVTTPTVTLLPTLAARLVTEMQVFEIMDGDTGCVPLTWVTSVLDTLTEDLNDPKVLVISVIGVQSSGKSTLLNSMFGVRFPVRAGRCTRGLFAQLLKVSDELAREVGFHYLVVVDSEGIRSIDHDDRRFDNELVTLALSIANVTIFNIEGENIGPDMTGMLQIAAHALMRMKEVDLECQCRIVQQRVSDMTASDRNKSSIKTIKEILDAATRFAAEEEGLEGRYHQFSDVVDLHVDMDLQYVPCLWAGGMAPPNHLYSETVSKIKCKLIDDVRKGNISPNLTLSTFTERIRDVWKAVKEENFIFNFQDSVKAVDFNKFCLEYNQWIARMRQDVQSKIREVLFSVQVDPESESLQPNLTILKECIETEIKEQRCKLTKCVKDHIEQHPRKNTIMRYRQEFLSDVTVVLSEIEAHSLAKITDEYEIRKISLNLPNFQNKSRQILTLEAQAEARKVTNTLAVFASDHFDTIWRNMIGKLKRKNNITHVPVTPSSLQNVCEKLLLKVTRDMAVGSEIQTLLSQEGGIKNHISLEHCSKYISDKFVKSWLQHDETSSKTEMKEKNSVGNERQHFVVEEMVPKAGKILQLQSYLAELNTRNAFRQDSTSKSRKGERIPSESEKQLIEGKRRQAIMYLQSSVEKNLDHMRKLSKAFDANVFQLMLRKTLKQLSTKHDTLNIKLPQCLIAKGLLHFCCRSLKEFYESGDSEIERFLDFSRNVIQNSYHSFISQKEQDDVAVEYISYYTEKIFREMIATFCDKIYDNVNYSQYTKHVHIPWDILHFLYDDSQIPHMYRKVIFKASLRDIVNVYVERKEQVCSEEIRRDVERTVDAHILKLIDNIRGVQFHATDWKKWCQILGNSLGCPFIQSAGDIFQVTDVSTVVSMLQRQLAVNLFKDDYVAYEKLNYTSFKNAAGLSYVCNEVCPMCGAWCDNKLESHKVHSSSLHRPRGLNGERYLFNCSTDRSSSTLSSDSTSNEEMFGEYVLEDCYMSICSETATFHYEGQTLLCKNFKDLFRNWDIHPKKDNAFGKLFWQRLFVIYYNGVASNIPQSWKLITDKEALLSLQMAHFAQLNMRKLMSSMFSKKPLLII